MKEYRTRASTIILRSDNIVMYVSNEEWKEPDTLEIAKESMSMIKKVIDNQARGFLVIVPSNYISKDILQYYQQVEVGDVARALVLNSFATKLIGNLYFKLSKGKPNEAGRIVPTKLFTDKEEGVKWLLEKMEKAK